MREPIFILRGNIVYSKSQTELAVCEHGYLVCKGEKVEGDAAQARLWRVPGTNLARILRGSRAGPACQPHGYCTDLAGI